MAKRKWSGVLLRRKVSPGLSPIEPRRRIRTLLATRNEKRYKRALFGDLAPLVPPVSQMFDGPPTLEEFKANGEEFLRIYREVCALRPDERMLDVGCGTGRKTWPLIAYFDHRAVYEGFDVARAGVEWCRNAITPHHPNFRFQHVDVRNYHFNPEGTLSASEFRFPYPDRSFTFVMLGSVFTHMLPQDVQPYLSEVQRVLTNGGRCLITYFLLNADSLARIEAKECTLDMKYAFEGYRSVSGTDPEEALGLEENWVKSLYARLGLEIARVEYGYWCPRADALTYQDLVLAVKG